jgi:hypothetical protein
LEDRTLDVQEEDWHNISFSTGMDLDSVLEQVGGGGGFEVLTVVVMKTELFIYGLFNDCQWS